MDTSTEFRIPAEFLKLFQHEMRFVPQITPNNGYIIFDIDMLSAVLRRGDAKAATALADQLDVLKKAQGQLVIVAKQTAQMR